MQQRTIGKELSDQIVAKIGGAVFEDATLQVWGHSLNLSNELDGEPKPVRFIGHWPRDVRPGNRFLFKGNTTVIAVEVMESSCMGDPRDMYSGMVWVYGQAVMASGRLLYFPKPQAAEFFSRDEEFEPAFIHGAKKLWARMCGRKAA